MKKIFLFSILLVSCSKGDNPVDAKFCWECTASTTAPGLGVVKSKSNHCNMSPADIELLKKEWKRTMTANGVTSNMVCAKD